MVVTFWTTAYVSVIYTRDSTAMTRGIQLRSIKVCKVNVFNTGDTDAAAAGGGCRLQTTFCRPSFVIGSAFYRSVGHVNVTVTSATLPM